MSISLAQSAFTMPTSAVALFYWTLLFIFLTAIVTAIVTKWSRDKCLKFFNHYHITLQRAGNSMNWGRFRVLSSGVEVLYDQPHVDGLGHAKASVLIYQAELEPQVVAVFRYHNALDADMQDARRRQVRRSFNPGPLRRLWRWMRNLVNTLRDAFNAAIGTAVGQYKQLNPTNSVVAAQSAQVTQIGQTLLGKFANAYEPLLEQYIGRPVILNINNPQSAGGPPIQYTGYLADYTQAFVAIFNVEHPTQQETTLILPPARPPPDQDASAPAPPAVMGLLVQRDGPRFKIQNTDAEPVVIHRLTREGFEPLVLELILPPAGILDLPARDADGGVLHLERICQLDIVAPRKIATIRHAGELVERRGIVDELHLDQLPLVPILLNRDERPK